MNHKGCRLTRLFSGGAEEGREYVSSVSGGDARVQDHPVRPRVPRPLSEAVSDPQHRLPLLPGQDTLRPWRK